MKSFRFVDLFCGGGGSITGAINALNDAGIKYDGRGFNHWDIAIQTIRMNHPEVVPDFERACADIADVNPWDVFQEDPERLDVLWASPSCTHHSNAAGGKPRSNQLRSQPENLLPFLRLTKCRRMFVENVKELKNWGPILDKDTVFDGKKIKAGQADPRQAGKFFNLWFREIKASGYTVDMQIMNAADYGAATSRERLIIQAVRKSSGEKIVWPEPTHTQDPGLLSGIYEPWRSAHEIIDWNIPGKSIFDREKPLCENTIRRIEAGIRKYWGAWAEPFLIVLRGTSDNAINSTAMSLSTPLLTLTAGGEHFALIQPIVMDQSHPGDLADAVRCRSFEPFGTFTTRNNWSCVMPMFIPQQSCGEVRPVNNPLSTISTSGAIGIVEPFLSSYYQGSTNTSSCAPCPTITTHDRFALIQGRILSLPNGARYKLDITHRMLTAKELAAATGFPDGYHFAGGDTAAKKQIGNAVCPDLAKALYLAILAA